MDTNYKNHREIGSIRKVVLRCVGNELEVVLYSRRIKLEYYNVPNTYCDIKNIKYHKLSCKERSIVKEVLANKKYHGYEISGYGIRAILV